MGMGYCLMCGKLRDTWRGVCATCATDEYERRKRARVRAGAPYKAGRRGDPRRCK